MAEVRLTKTLVEGEQPTGVDRFLWDASLRGFGVKITPRGSKVYVAQFRPKGSRTTRRYTIGRHGSPWTTDRAREEASTLLARARLGEDPFLTDKGRRKEEQAAAEAKKAAAAQAKAEAFSVVVAQFIERYARPRNRSWEETERILTSDDLLPWRQRSIRSITRKDVLGLVDTVSDRSSSSARLLFAHLRKLFNWCLERGYVETSPCLGLKGPAGPRSRDRWLSDDELTIVWLACAEVGWPFGPLFQLLILTAQRREEVCGMAWSEIDLDRAEWTIPAARAKNGRAHRVDLSPEAVGILRGQNFREGLVFSTTGTAPVSGHSRAKKRLDAAIKAVRARAAGDQGLPEQTQDLPSWRVHDLRRTAATGMARLGHPPHVVEAVLNHVSGSRGGLVAVYQHYDHRAERKAALLAWADHISSLRLSAAVKA